MNVTQRTARRFFISSLFFNPLFFCLLIGGQVLGADELARTARVVAIRGRAQMSREGGRYTPLAVGAQLRAGDVVQTAVGSAIDLQLGEPPGLVRLTEGATMAIEKLDGSEKLAGASSVELALRSGELLGQAKVTPVEARFEVKTSSGIARIFRGRFRIQARGFLVVLDGKAIFAHVPATGEPAAHILNAPPACYFTPGAGVQPAPKALVKEVENQFRAKLPK